MSSTPPDWYDTFFNGLALELWRRAIPPEHTKKEAAYIAKMLRLPERAEVLDVPCGNGRHAAELAALGHRLTGVDLSEGFVCDARTAFESRGLSGGFVLGDMRRLPWQSRFQGAYCFGNSFGYMEHEGSLEFLAALARALQPGARFVLETGIAAESILPKLEDRFAMEFGDLSMSIENRYDAAKSVLETSFTFVRGTEREDKQSLQHVYTAAEFERMLAAAGLATEAMHGSIDGDEYRLGAQRLLLTAVKR